LILSSALAICLANWSKMLPIFVSQCRDGNRERPA
jgi:hypothetical protein